MKTDLHYAILGDGRLARHMRHYLELEGFTVSGWARNGASTFNTYTQADAESRMRSAVQHASHVLLLVSDDAIPDLLRSYPWLHHKELIHCAGALSLPGVAGAHPLMTFSDTLYAQDRYRQIPFLVEEGYRFDALFPGLENPSHCVRVEQKALYHALCVMAGNFPQLLWQSVSETMDRELDLPPAILGPYLQQVTNNFLADPEGALTGPLARGDHQTISRNLSSLEGQALQAIYRTFLEHYVQLGETPQAIVEVQS